MNRLPVVVVLGLLAAGAAWADIPPPKGFKRVVVDHKITTEKAYPDYVFFTVIGGGKVAEVKLDPKTPAVIPGAGRGGVGRLGSFVAVPKDAARKYGTEKELHAAVAGGKVEGLVRARANFGPIRDIKDTDPRTAIVVEHKIEKIDPKAGIVFAGEKPEPEESDEPGEELGGYTPKGGAWVAGLAATTGLVLGGLWLAGRSRRREVA